MLDTIKIDSFGEDLNNITIEDIFNLDDLQEVQDAFSQATGVASMITSPEGIPITNPSNFCSLCRDVIRKTEKGRQHCRESDSYIGKSNSKGPRIKKCLSGSLWDAGASIVVGNKHIANWLIGQVLDDKPNYAKMKNYAIEIGTDVDSFMAALEEVPIMSKEQFKKIADYLYLFANQLSKLALNNYLMTREIKARKTAERALFDTKEKLSLIINQLPGAIWSVNKDLIFTFIDGSFLNSIGFEQVDLLYKSLIDFILENSLDPLTIENHNKALSGESIRYEARFADYYLEIFLKPLYNSKKEISGVLGIALDITQKKKAEIALQVSEQRFRDVASAAGEFLWEINISCRFILVTKRAEEILGYSLDEIIGKTPFDFCFQNDVNKLKTHLTHIFIEKKAFSNFEFRAVDKLGRIFWLLISGIPFFDAYENIIGLRGTALDISARKRTEMLLLESEKKYRELYQANQDGWTKISMSGAILQFNNAYKNMLGYTDDELRFRNVSMFTSKKWLDIGLKIIKSEVMVRGYSNIYEIEHIKKDGTVFPVELRLYLAKENGLAVGIWGFIRDISERKNSEKEKEKLINDLEAKNAEMEKFTYTVSHDLRSPLITIKGFIGMIAQDMSSGNYERAARDLDRIGNAADKMKYLLEDLLELSRIGRIVNTPELVDLNQLIIDVMEMMTVQISESKVKININNKLPLVYVDKTRISEVFQNLIENSIKFSNANEIPVIDISCKEIGEFYEISVKDNGIGIEPKYYDKIFGLFDKLNISDEGTGVGLALVKRIIEIHGGKINVISDGLGNGATFIMSLPKTNMLNS